MFLRVGFRVFDLISVIIGLFWDFIYFIFLMFVFVWYVFLINKLGDDYWLYYFLLIINGKCNIVWNMSKNNLFLLL